MNSEQQFYLMFALESCIVPRKETNYSIKLEPVSQLPSHHHKCACDMCNEYQAEAISKMMNRNSEKIMNKLKVHQNNGIHSTSYEYVLKRLITPNNKIITQAINIFIPQVCFYKDGEATSLFMNVDPFQKNNQFKFDLKDKKDPIIIRLKKEKLTNTTIQKIFNEKRRKYREKVGTALRRKISRKLSSFGKKQPMPQTKDAIVITYNDGYQQLQTENEFINLTLKRKQDPFFKKINFIKNFIGVTQEDKRVLMIKHKSSSTKYEKLLSRSQILMKCYATNISPGDNDYISYEDQAKFLQGLQKSSKDALAHYTLYKIISFIETFHDERISQISVKFLLNECCQLYLLHVYSHVREELVKYAWTQESYMKKVMEEENKFLCRNVNLQEDDEKGQQRSGKIQKQMRSQYEQLKYAMGLAHVEKNDTQEKANDTFFSVLYPSLPNPISQILKDKGLTVIKFKQKYLGYKHQKRSVAQSFNSNLVKTLHKMAPKLKVAQPHQIDDINFPKSSFSNRSGKRSFSMGTTLSTANKTMTIFL